MYFRFYQLMESVGNGDIAPFAALMLFTLMLSLNLVAILVLIYRLSSKLVYLLDAKPLVVIGVLALIAMILYVTLVARGGLEGIRTRFEGESDIARRHGRLACWVNIGLSFVGMILAMMFLG